MKQQKNAVIPVTEHFRGKFNTSTGRTIDLLDPTPDSLHIDDIAKALSRICRFGGHSNAFYSVAQHSLMVAAILPPKYKQYGLLHDASEAYLGDVIKPLKVLIEPHYRQIEERFEKAIARKFNLVVNAETKDEVKSADVKMLVLEHEALILGKPGGLIAKMGDFVLEETGWAWKPELAQELFIATYKKLFAE